MGRYLVALLIIFVSSSNVWGNNSQRWWEKKEEGWFFYNEKDENENVLPPESSRPSKLQTVEDIKQEGEKLLHNALISPTPENVKRYMVFQKKMMEMAEKFAVVWQKVIMENPDLAGDSYRGGRAKLIEDKIREGSEKYGMFYFYNGSCPFCKRMEETIVAFREKYPEFVVLPVSLDGNILSKLPDTKIDNGVSQYMGVENVPAVYLVDVETENFARISEEFLVLYELEQKIYHHLVFEEFKGEGVKWDEVGKYLQLY